MMRNAKQAESNLQATRQAVDDDEVHLAGAAQSDGSILRHIMTDYGMLRSTLRYEKHTLEGRK